MFSTVLVNRIDTDSDSQTLREVFFQIGNMEENRDKLMDTFNDVDCKFYGRCLFQYNGITLKLTVQEIPQVVSYLVDLNLDVYAVYEPYQPL